MNAGLLFCPGTAAYCDDGEATELDGVGADVDDDGGPDEKVGLIGSAKKSEGENPSGLLWCEGESPLWFDRAMEGAFLRTGRIHGGRVAFGGPSWWGVVSRGMLVTR